MHWLRGLLFLTSGIFLNYVFVDARTKEDVCISMINWRELWENIDSLNKEGLSQECLLMDKSSLCDPAQVVITSASKDAAIILQILGETKNIFKREDVPFPAVRDFLEHNDAAQEDLNICLASRLSHRLTASTVRECYRKMHVFLNSEDNSCTWQVVHNDCLVILQRLQYYIDS